MPEFFDPIEITMPGPERPPELKVIDGQPVIVHYGDIPEKDLTVHRGIPVTTPLRTVIDLAPRVGRGALERMVRDCLKRGLFTIDGATERLAEDDMVNRPEAQLVSEVLFDCL
jgi:hypothetical protein